MMKKTRPILVTGATGSIGFVLVKCLCESGQSVRAIVRNPSKAAALKCMANVEILPGDLSHPDSLRGCADGCSLVYHCAAKLPSSDWEGAYATNVIGTQALVNEAIRSQVERFIYTSTIGVYGLSKGETITEDFPWPECKLPYFATKQEAEKVVWKAADKLTITIARPGGVMGPGQYSYTSGTAGGTPPCTS